MVVKPNNRTVLAGIWQVTATSASLNSKTINRYLVGEKFPLSYTVGHLITDIFSFLGEAEAHLDYNGGVKFIFRENSFDYLSVIFENLILLEESRQRLALQNNQGSYKFV